jgi:hypothetical protein
VVNYEYLDILKRKMEKVIVEEIRQGKQKGEGR